MNKRTAIVVAVVAVLLVVPPAGSASAHEEHKVTGTLGGKQADQSSTSGRDGFDEVTDPSEVQYPVRQPSGSQLTNRLDRETTRLNTALAAQREAVDKQVAGARRLAAVGPVVGALGLLATVGVGALALRRRS